jgi:hypothetical protein
MKLDEYWRLAQSQVVDPDDHTTTELPLTWNDGGTTKSYAVINTQNDAKWELKSDGWYYYTDELEENDSTLSLLESVTLNCDAKLVENGVATATQGGQVGQSTPTAYAGATYHLYVTMQLSDTEWPDDTTSYAYNIVKEQANDSFNIDFRKRAIISDDQTTANGNGVNTYTEDGEDVYYYRGMISDNNVLWGGYCWKIMRTTATGGTKLMYSGEPTTVGGEQQCLASGADMGIVLNSNRYFKYTGTNSAINDSPASVGYMYGDVVEPGYASTTGITFTFSKHVSRSGDTYTLDTSTGNSVSGTWDSLRSGGAYDYHYFCLDGTTSCDSNNIAYVATYNLEYSYYSIFYLPIGGYDDVEDMKDAMFANEHDSYIKTVVEDWFEASGLTSYEGDLEDAIFCNDRTILSGTLAGEDSGAGNPNDYNYSGFNKFGSYIRNRISVNNNYHPSLDCTNKRDAFTKDDTTNGNGMLEHKVGLFTYDELVLAGHANSSGDAYFADDNWHWTMSPQEYFVNGQVFNWSFDIDSENSLSNSYLIRPAVSLKYGMKFASGDGTTTSPYVVR